MPNHRLLTAAAALSLMAGLAAPAFAQAPATATAQTEKQAAQATGKASTDGPAATAVQGTARAVGQAGVNAQAVAPAAAPAPPAEPALVPAPSAPTAVAAKLVPSGDTAATLRQSADFSTFVKALDAVNLAGMIQTRPGMTVFAPTNAAFAALPAGQLNALMADKTALQKLLLHHIINAKVDTTKIKGTRGPWPSGAGDKIVLDGSTDGVIKADNATITQPDVTTPNGTIQVVDNVLIAGSVPLVLAEPAPPPEAAPPPPAPAKVVTKTKTVTKKKK